MVTHRPRRQDGHVIDGGKVVAAQSRSGDHGAMTHGRRLGLIGLVPVVGCATWLVAHLRSPAVRAWHRPSLPASMVGRLFTCVGGDGEFGVLLLHGLIATGDIFAVAAEELAEHHRVAVPDLLGFGRSLDESVDDFGTEAHLAALEFVINEALGDRPLLIGAHSMGSTLALRLANRMPDRVAGVLCLGAPIWSNPHTSIANAGPMARAFVLNERLAATICRWNCHHRQASGWLSAAIAVQWPTRIARQASLHTWPAYHQAMEQQILDVDWSTLLTSLGQQRVPITLAWGSRDLIGDPTYAGNLVEALDTINIEIIPGANHSAPVAHPALFGALLPGNLTPTTTADTR